MRLFSTILAAALLSAVAASPAAAAVQYDFVATSSYGGAYGSFSFVAPDFISSPLKSGTSIAAASLTSCSVTFGGGGCGSQTLFNITSNLTGSPSDAVQFGTTAEPSAAVYYFADGALTSAGTYSSILLGSRQAATLRVSVLTPTGAVPEPASWAMMLIGFGAAGTALRQRRAGANLDARTVAA